MSRPAISASAAIEEGLVEHIEGPLLEPWQQDPPVEPDPRELPYYGECDLCLAVDAGSMFHDCSAGQEPEDDPEPDDNWSGHDDYDDYHRPYLGDSDFSW